MEAGIRPLQSLIIIITHSLASTKVTPVKLNLKHNMNDRTTIIIYMVNCDI